MSILSDITGLFGGSGNNPTSAVAAAPGITLTSAQLQTIMPHIPVADLDSDIQYLNAAMAEGEINTINRISAFLGQLSVESNELRELIENTNYGAAGLMSTWPHLF